MTDPLNKLLGEQGYVVLDGAMGTQLFAAGLTSGDPPERWNVEHPERVKRIHDGYIAAGSDVVLTNSFGGTRYRLALHGLESRVREFSAAAASVARQAADAVDRTVLVAGSMGPTGELIEPLGALTPDDAESAFEAQAVGLTDGGADLLWLETMSDLNELTAAVAGARKGSDLPIVATMSFDTAGRTMMGVGPTDVAGRMADAGLVAIGANCGNNIADTEAVVREIRELMAPLSVVSKANAGIPEWHGTELHYDATPEVLAAHAHRVHSAGVEIIGGCCGSTPEHIAMIKAVLSGEVQVTEPPPEPVQRTTVDRDHRRSRRRRRST
ncbi:MAG: betaine--homocysteine S-methyltransferase [Acidimicrobiales bacterium]